MKTNTESMSAKNNSNQKHRWYDVIVAWAEGKEIQFKYDKGEWMDYTGGLSAIPAFNSLDLDWRVKPKTVTKRYRMVLCNMCSGIKTKQSYVRVVDITESSIDDPAEYNVEGFIRWLGDSVEVELEVKDGNE